MYVFVFLLGQLREQLSYLKGDNFFRFTCSDCSEDGKEQYERLKLTWQQVSKRLFLCNSWGWSPKEFTGMFGERNFYELLICFEHHFLFTYENYVLNVWRKFLVLSATIVNWVWGS